MLKLCVLTSEVSQQVDWSLYDGYEGTDTSKCNTQKEDDGQHFPILYATIEKRHPRTTRKIKVNSAKDESLA